MNFPQAYIETKFGPNFFPLETEHCFSGISNKRNRTAGVKTKALGSIYFFIVKALERFKAWNVQKVPAESCTNQMLRIWISAKISSTTPESSTVQPRGWYGLSSSFVVVFVSYPYRLGTFRQSSRMTPISLFEVTTNVLSQNVWLKVLKMKRQQIAISEIFERVRTLWTF